MCTTCGCGKLAPPPAKIDPSSLALRADPPTHMHALEVELLGKNDALAAQNRARFATRNVFAVNLMSSPGSGKTTLLERTLAQGELRGKIGVIEGDQETERDAARIRATGAPAVQVNTGAGCHLDASMIARALPQLDDRPIVVIENVGNLVCPALFDLGEAKRAVLFSVTEGEDKPHKYPHMFRAADLVLLSKIDLLPYVPFDERAALACVREVNPHARVMRVSSTTGEGFAEWCAWLTSAGGGA